MKTCLLISFLVFFGVRNYAQDVKMVQIKGYDTVEEYYVLKSKKKIKHGEYIKKTKKGVILENGIYENNKKAGIWTYKDYDDRILYIFDHTNIDMIEYNWYDQSNKYLVLRSKEWNVEEIDNPPILLDGQQPRVFIQKNLKYPRDAAVNGKSGRVYVSFVIDTSGAMSNIRVTEKVYPALDEEALRVVKSMKSFQWLPAMKNEKKITIDYYMPIVFQLQ